MRLVPFPADLKLPETFVKSALGPPREMDEQDCDIAEVAQGYATLPSGAEVPTVSALVHMSAEELAQVEADGGRLILEFIGVTFPPVIPRTVNDWLGSPPPTEEPPGTVG